MIPVVAVASALAALPVYREDLANPYKGAQLYTVAQAIASVARTKEEAAFLITLGHHETKFSFRVHLGICRQYECDTGRAIGLWQVHKNWRTEDEWHGFAGLSLDATRGAAFAALQHVRYAERACRWEPEPVVATFRAYAGIGCRVPLRGERERVVTFNAARGKLGL